MHTSVRFGGEFHLMVSYQSSIIAISQLLNIHIYIYIYMTGMEKLLYCPDIHINFYNSNVAKCKLFMINNF